MIRSKWRISRWRWWIKHFNMRREAYNVYVSKHDECNWKMFEWKKSKKLRGEKVKDTQRDSTSENNFLYDLFFVFHHHYLLAPPRTEEIIFQSLNCSREIFACASMENIFFIIYLNDLMAVEFACAFFSSISFTSWRSLSGCRIFYSRCSTWCLMIVVCQEAMCDGDDGLWWILWVFWLVTS